MSGGSLPGSAGFVLLGGSGSSGTTLIASVLDGLHDLRTTAETWLFHQRQLHRDPTSLSRLLREGGESVTRPVGRLAVPLVPGGCFVNRDLLGMADEAIPDDLELEAYVARVKAAMAARWGGPTDFLWVDQTPKNAFAAKEYLQSQPDGRFIHILRDGRDVVCSLIGRWQREAPGHPMRDYLVGSAMNWAWDVTQARRARGMPGYLEVRYEDFVRDPVGTTNRMLIHLGRPPVTPDVFEANRRGGARAERMAWGAKPSWGATPDQPIHAGSVGKWRQKLSPQVVKALRTVRFAVPGEGQVSVGQVLDSCGYWG